MRTRRVDIYRTGRYHTLGEDARDEAWMVCHGYGQAAANFLRHFEPLTAPHRLIIAPEGLSRFYTDDRHEHVGASWMTREDRGHEIADYVRWLDTVYSDALTQAATPLPERLITFGFSQGCATVVRWLAQSAMLPPHRCARLILWGGTLPPDLDLSAHREWLSGRLTLVVGESDPFVTAERLDQEEARLRDHGIDIETERFPGGHRLNRTVLTRLAAG